jgi:hypothetical protein
LQQTLRSKKNQKSLRKKFSFFNNLCIILVYFHM